jgi:hypothetical protein
MLFDDSGTTITASAFFWDQSVCLPVFNITGYMWVFYGAECNFVYTKQNKKEDFWIINCVLFLKIIVQYFIIFWVLFIACCVFEETTI